MLFFSFLKLEGRERQPSNFLFLNKCRLFFFCRSSIVSAESFPYTCRPVSTDRNTLQQGSPAPGPHSTRWAAGHRAKLHRPLPVAHISHPSPPPSVEKSSSAKPVPGAKKVGERCLIEPQDSHQTKTSTLAQHHQLGDRTYLHIPAFPPLSLLCSRK